MDYNIFHLFFKHGKTFKEVSEESEKITKEMTDPWEKTALPTILAIHQLKGFFMQMNLVYSMKQCHQNLFTSDVSIAQVENTANCG